MSWGGDGKYVLVRSGNKSYLVVDMGGEVVKGSYVLFPKEGFSHFFSMWK